jgi:anti-sigma B factor antagonist
MSFVQQPAASRSFQLQSVALGDRQTLVLSGEIDLLAAAEIEATIRALCPDGMGEIVLDLRKVTFMDSAGLMATVSAREICRRSGYGFAIVPGPEQVQRLFEMTGLVPALETPLPTSGRPSRAGRRASCARGEARCSSQPN